jgi:ribosomal protein S18 acetylase RimI-like enzyme
MSITIRQATVRDLDTLWKIEKECFTSEAFTKEQLEYLLEASEGVSLIAQINHEIAGFIMSLIYSRNKMRVGHVYTIDVLTKYRRRGVASRLLDELERILIDRGVKVCYLEVLLDNVAARKLYEKHGYVEIGQLRDHYGRGVHGIRLKKPLF